MRSRTTFFLLVVSTVGLLLSCNKSGTDEPDNSPKTLILGTWKMTAYIHNGADVFGTQVGTCVTDDIVTFVVGGGVSVDEGPTKCDASDPQTQTGTYSLNATGTQITIVGFGQGSQTDDIVVLNTTTLKIRQISNDDLITYTRQP